MSYKNKAMALLAAAAVGCTVSAPPAGAATASNLTPISMGYGDSFWNYDFNSTAGGNSNVDWAMNLLFYGNAKVNDVKAIVDPWLYTGSFQDKYARLDDGSGAVWDGDGGRKDNPCPVGTVASHVRFYADSDDRMYNPTHGYYVLATSHWDINECGGGTSEFGHSEWAERDLGDWLRNRGYYSVQDRYGWLNYEPSRYEGNHYWLNNGLTTTIKIP